MSKSSSPAKPSPSLLALPPYDSTPSSRLQALYSDISRQKHSNPTSYHSNIQWWRRALESIVSSGLQPDASRLVLHGNRNLLDTLRVQGAGKPLALGAVITELRSSKSLIPRTEFMNARNSVYDPGWLPGRIATFVVGKPLWWALEQMGVVGEDGILGGVGSSDKDTGWWGEYVVLALVEKAADEVLVSQAAKVGGPGDMLYSFEGFRKEFASILGSDLGNLSQGDTQVLLRFLERDRRSVVVDSEVIKFVDKDAGPQLRGINAVDKGILELKTAVANSHVQIESIQQKIDECTRKASTALQQKHKPIALSQLRSRKQLEELLARRLGSLGTLESTLIRVESAAGDVEIMKSYEKSTATLRAILAHPSLQRDSIERTMDAMAEATADAKEVDEAIRIGGDMTMEGADDEELEKELQMLAREAEDEAAQEDAKIKLDRDHLKAPTDIPVRSDPQREERDAQPLVTA